MSLAILPKNKKEMVIMALFTIVMFFFIFLSLVGSPENLGAVIISLILWVLIIWGIIRLIKYLIKKYKKWELVKFVDEE